MKAVGTAGRPRTGPGRGDVRVKVRTAGVNHAMAKVAAGGSKGKTILKIS